MRQSFFPWKPRERPPVSSWFAVVVPARRRAELDSLASRAERMLKAGWPGREVLRAEEHGRTASVAFGRVAGDPFFPARSAVREAGPLRAVQAGYFLEGAMGGDRGSSRAASDSSTAREASRAAGKASNSAGTAGSLVRTLALGGTAALEQGDGVYSFGSWNTATETFSAGVDKLGMRPLYWCELKGGGVAVASEIKLLLPLVEHPGVNWAAWEDQVRHGFQIGEHTLVHGIHRFARAGCLTWHDGSLTHTVLERFLENARVRQLSEAEFVEENHAAFSQSMSRLLRVMEGAAPMLTISGGLDSRRILAGLLSEGCSPELLTVALPKADGRDVESAITEMVAREAGLPLNVVRPTGPGSVAWAADARDAYADFETDEHGVYALIAAASGTRAAVNFDGLSGDTLLNPAQFVSKGYLGAGGEERFLATMSAGGHWLRLPSSGEPFAERLRRVWSGMREAPNPITIFALDTRGRRELSLGPMLIQARAFESVYPFLDREFMRSALALAPEVRLGRQWQSVLTRRASSGLASIPSTRDPDFERVDGLVRQLPGWGAQRPRGVLRRALWSGSSAACLPAGERLKLALATALGERIGADSFDWQWGKANWVRRMRQQEELMQAGWERYAEFVSSAIAPPSGIVALEQAAR